MGKLALILLISLIFLGCIQSQVYTNKTTDNHSNQTSYQQNATNANNDTSPNTSVTSDQNSTNSTANQNNTTTQSNTTNSTSTTQETDSTEPPPIVETNQSSTIDITETPQQTFPNLISREFSYNSGAWIIRGTLYPSISKAPTKIVILLHELGQNRSAYPKEFIAQVHNNLTDALILAIDLRGHGKSTNLGTWESFNTIEYKNMRLDIMNLKTPIAAQYPNVKNYYLVGASIGSTAAILTAGENELVTKVVMLSPGMKYNGVDITSAVDDEYRHDLLVVASTNDSYSLRAVNQIKTLTSESQTTDKVYPGSAHGTEIFNSSKESDSPLSKIIVEFLKKE